MEYEYDKSATEHTATVVPAPVRPSLEMGDVNPMYTTDRRASKGSSLKKRNSQVSVWSPSDVRAFIEDQAWIKDRQAIAKRFEDEEIDGTMMMELQPDDFKSLGVKIGYRFRIQRMLQDEHDESAAENRPELERPIQFSNHKDTLIFTVFNAYVLGVPAALHFIQKLTSVPRDNWGGGHWIAVGLWLSVLICLIGVWAIGSGKISAYVLDAATPMEIKENTRSIWTNVALVAALFITVVPGMFQIELTNDADEELLTHTLYGLLCATDVFFILLSLVQCVLFIVTTEPLQPVPFAKFILTFPNTPGEPAAVLMAGVYAIICTLLTFAWNSYSEITAWASSLMLLFICTHFCQIVYDKSAFEEHGTDWTRGHSAEELVKNAGYGGKVRGVAREGRSFAKFYNFIVEQDSRSKEVANGLIRVDQ
jgi:hypothetical protein